LALPLWVTVLSGDDDDRSPVWLEDLGCARADGCTRETAVVAQRATVSFVRDSAATVTLLLAGVCAGRSCALSERCAVDTGRCIDANAQEEVVLYTGALPPRWADAGVDATVDAGLDAGLDAASDVRPDAYDDAGMDAGEDAGKDAGVDAGEDADAGTDAGEDLRVDAEVDAGVDATPAEDVARCPSGFTDCTGQCRALGDDPAHCGACDRACATGQDCLLGVCLCPSRTSFCGGACVDTSTDGANCGGCGRACATGQQCIAGMCQVVCTAGQNLCGSTCVDTNTDIQHCGTCGTRCLNSALCAAGRCTGGSVAGTSFQVVSLNTTGCRVADHNAVTGDDRGGIAVTDTQVFYTGDTTTGRFDPDTLAGLSVGTQYDGLVSNLNTGQLYTLAMGDQPMTSTGGRIDTLLELNRTTGARTTTRVALTPPIMLPALSFTGGIGFFSGWDRVVLLAGGRAYNINLTNGGVTDLGAVTFPATAQRCEVGALWGVAEFFNNAVHIAYVQRAVGGQSTITRMRLPDGMTSTLSQFANLGDMCAFTVSPSRRRWYFHHEGTSQFGGTAETIGYCDAVMAGPTLPCAAGLTLCSSVCRNTQSDAQHCGGCGIGCASDRACMGGTCVPACPAGQSFCGGTTCLDLQSNNSNCGACGRACISGQFCVGGACSGGPRYTRSNSPESFVQACSAPGNTRILQSVDDSTLGVAAPFPLRFWGTQLESPRVVVSSNGWISPTYTGTTAFLSGLIPSSSDPDGVIAAQWLDLRTGPSGICVATLGVTPNRRWYFHWSHALNYSSGSSLDFEIVLHETTGIIDLLYGTMTGAQRATVGIENSTGSLGVGGCEDGTTTCIIASNTRIRFTPSP